MSEGLILCDLTQSYASTGGGIRTYLTEKRKYIDSRTPHTHLLIIPGETDRTYQDGRHITVEIASPKVPGSPMYRLLLRSKAVIEALRTHRPASVECLDAYNLPWAAISYRKERPETVLLAGYRTDFPTVYVQRFGDRYFGSWAGARLRTLGYRYAGSLYRKFDGLYALNREMADYLAALDIANVDVLPLGTDIDLFHPNKRDDAFRAEHGVRSDGPLLVYAGRIDREKAADIVYDAFEQLPSEMNASLVMLGEGNLRDELRERAAGAAAVFPGYIGERPELARALASADLYVSAMPYETFGISIIEAQASGLPVVGVAAGAMPDRVPDALGLLGPVGDAAAMARNIERIWTSPERFEMAAAARAHVEARFSWARTFEHLFETIYPRARRRNAAKRGVGIDRLDDEKALDAA